MGTRATCCQFADDAALGDAEVFDCSTCEYRRLRDALAPENAVAWEVWRLIGSRFCVDFGTAGWALRAVTADWPADDVQDLVQRLALIYDAVAPPPER